ncbi:MAG TPA: ribonuclease H-like domain-containing protein, partial [Candidatus Saccharimonadales bacterium]|nr:ribonuclease H-like domain-containing protein [Candidatus Saccharimonadales bacterium]
ADDSLTVKAIVQELAKYDIWIAHNGAKFDVPFLRTRLLAHRLPPLNTPKLVDPVQLARNKLRLSYNSLDRIAEHLGCNSKTKVSQKRWLAATLDGDIAAMDYIVKHCVEDVRTLDQVVGRIKTYAGQLNSWGSAF